MKKWILLALFGLLSSAMAQGFSISAIFTRTTYATFKAELTGAYVANLADGLDVGLPITASTDPLYDFSRFNLEISPFIRYNPEIFRVDGFWVNVLARFEAPFKVLKSLDPNPNNANTDERTVRFGFYDFAINSLFGLESTLRLGQGIFLTNALKYSLPLYPFYTGWYASGSIGFSYILDPGVFSLDAVALVSDTPFNGKFTASLYYPINDNLYIAAEAIYNIRDGFSVSLNTTLKF